MSSPRDLRRRRHGRRCRIDAPGGVHRDLLAHRVRRLPEKVAEGLPAPIRPDRAEGLPEEVFGPVAPVVTFRADGLTAPVGRTGALARHRPLAGPLRRPARQPGRRGRA